jgi:2-polyprenyl-3-methyl-5-hydroxy-6-metoxy-1,4-benzoquinol methylase
MAMLDQQIDRIRAYWDEEAARFDNEPDNGLRNPVVREAWTNCLVDWLPSPPSRVLDMGCGTESLSVVLASLGHEVTGVDLSPAMIEQAKAKANAAGCVIDFRVMNAAQPESFPLPFDVLLCRHLLWTLPEPHLVLQRWANLLQPEGRMVLIEGHWHTGGGLYATEVVAAFPPTLTNITVEHLSGRADLWGSVVSDERYVVRVSMS